MIKRLENQIRDLQRELGEIQKDQAFLCLQPCRGDSEIEEKDAKLDELNTRGTIIKEASRDLTRRRQLLISQSTTKGAYEPPNPDNSSQG